jgi:UDP-3-O-[3-hydroxymyristoyl] glucosamine N-acyltransferase
MTTLGELAKALELELRGDPTRSIANLAALESATPDDLSFRVGKKTSSQGIRYQCGRAHFAP